MPWHQYCTDHPWIRPFLPVSNGDDFTFCFLSHSKCFGSGVHRGHWGAMSRAALAGKRKIQVWEERRWVTVQSRPKTSPSPRRSLLLSVPLKSFLSEASDLSHLAPASTIGCGHFHGEGITLNRAVSLDQQQFPEILWATSSHQGSWEDYDLDLGERTGQHATAFTVVTDCGRYHRLSLSPAWPLFSLFLVFSDCKLTEIQCSGHVFLFLSCFSPPIWYVCKFFQP